MKVSQKQASLLAKEVVRQLKEKKSGKVSETIKSQLRSFLEKRSSLNSKINEARNELNKHDATITSIVGRGTSIGGYETFGVIIEKLEQKNIPKVSEIEDEIILKSMFASEDDLHSFIEGIVKKHSSKLQSKVVLN